MAVDGDYDADDDGLIEISSLAQLDVIWLDLEGAGASDHADYAAAFPGAMVDMGCPKGCSGYELISDLDFDTNGNGDADEGDAYWNDAYGWRPIGDPERGFRYNAVFDGGGHTIANLFIHWTDADHIGLFRATGEGAEIRNLNLAWVRVSGNSGVGGLVGSNYGIISSSSVTGWVSGAGGIGGLAGNNIGSIASSSAYVTVSGRDSTIGGLAGYNEGTIADSSASGEVTSEGALVGGLVGLNGGQSNISGSYATGNVTGAGEGNSVGGLVGHNHGGIHDSYAMGRVTSKDNRVGGLAGSSNGVITASYATGEVIGERADVGGLVGEDWGTITASYATGDVTSSWWHSIGGLVGSSDGAISASYATGRVIGNGSVGGLVGSAKPDSSIAASYAIGSVTGNRNVGGLVGSGSRDGVTDSYWDVQTTGQPNSAGGVGKITRALQDPTAATGIYANWNAEWWDFGTSRQYPALKYQGMDVAAQRP